ncbi:hypothetical protein AKJ16_DCAP05873 [Drosera capensis]
MPILRKPPLHSNLREKKNELELCAVVMNLEVKMSHKACRFAKQAAKRNSPPTKHVHHQTKALKVLQVKPMAKKEQMMMRFKSNHEPPKVVAMHRGSQQWLCYEKEITTELSRYFRIASWSTSSLLMIINSLCPQCCITGME